VPGPRSGDRTAQVPFDDADMDKNGSLDRDEAGRVAGFNFTSADVDDNARISRDEYTAVMRRSQPRS
jgi:hypothetical protein